MEENQPESSAAGCGRAGTDDTTLIEWVKPRSFGAAGDRLPVHLSSSKNHCMYWRYPDIRTKFKRTCGGARTSGETQLPMEKLSSKLVLISETSGSGE